MKKKFSLLLGGCLLCPLLISAAAKPKFQPPVCIQTPEIQYPGTLRGSLGRGVVQMVFVIGTDGRIKSTAVTAATHPDFVFSALDSFRNCKFRPALLDGKPVEGKFVQTVQFDVRAYGRSIGDETFDFRAVPSKQSPPGYQYERPAGVLSVVNPVYPFELALAGITGSAEVELRVGTWGIVSNAHAIAATHPEFGEALEAMVLACDLYPANTKGAGRPSLMRRRQNFAPGAETLAFDKETKRLIAELKTPQPNIVEDTQLPAPLRPIYQPLFRSGFLAQQEENRSAVIEFFVDRTGQAQLPRVVEASDRAFGWAAATVVQQWIFEKPLVHGQPAFVRMRVPLKIEFKK